MWVYDHFHPPGAHKGDLDAPICANRLRRDPRTQGYSPAYPRGQDREGGHALPQALHRPRGLPRAANGTSGPIGRGGVARLTRGPAGARRAPSSQRRRKDTNGTSSIRTARREDLGAIVALLADDELGRRREAAEEVPNTSYQQAFDQIDRDPRNELVVVEDEEGGVEATTLQPTYVPSLTHRGGERAVHERSESSKQGHRSLGVRGRETFDLSVGSLCVPDSSLRSAHPSRPPGSPWRHRGPSS